MGPYDPPTTGSQWFNKLEKNQFEDNADIPISALNIRFFVSGFKGNCSCMKKQNMWFPNTSKNSFENSNDFDLCVDK